MSSLTTQRVLDWFERVSAVPRTSRHEKEVSDLVRGMAEGLGYETWQDEHHNLLVRLPGTPGREDRPVLTLQAHLDMVGEKDPDSDHDFLTDPVRVVREGDVLSAPGTALGADDGIGVAIALCLLEGAELEHPPLELLFTTQEELGLQGAKLLPRGLLTGEALLNLDGETEGVFLASCAGGATIDIDIPMTPGAEHERAIQVRLSGFAGGHSGLDIARGRVNALLAAGSLVEAVDGCELVALEAPGKFNAISREARVVLAPAPSDEQVEALRTELATLEPEGTLEVTEVAGGRGWDAASTARLARLLAELPHGVHTMSQQLEGIVESSLNVGLAEASDEGVRVVASIRSSDAGRMDELIEVVRAAAERAGGAITVRDQYPAWQFLPDNPLLATAQQVHERLFGTPAKVTGVHGGLECAVLADIHPVPMLSVGSTLHDCHTPRERASVESIGRFAQLVAGIVQAA